MSVKKSGNYLEDPNVTLRSGHISLRKFLEKNTLKSKVYNWTIEISSFKIKFKCIKGINNTLEDTMNGLNNIDSNIQLNPEPEDHEFGCYVFNSLLNISTHPNKKNLSVYLAMLF